jgi:hypothetical protein
MKSGLGHLLIHYSRLLHVRSDGILLHYETKHTQLVLTTVAIMGVLEYSSPV